VIRRFVHDGVEWQVQLTGTGGGGCGPHCLEVVFSCPSTGEVVPGTVVVTGSGRLTDEALVAALDVSHGQHREE
jgi:hypothetical protein